MDSRMAQEIIFGLFLFSRNMILNWEEGGGGGLASRKASANFFPVLRDIWLVSYLWVLYKLFRYATNDHPRTTPKTLSLYTLSLT